VRPIEPPAQALRGRVTRDADTQNHHPHRPHLIERARARPIATARREDAQREREENRLRRRLALITRRSKTMATKNLGRENFEQTIRDGGIVIVDAWASWCGPCRAFAPIFEAASAQHPHITWAKLDTEREHELAHAFAIRSIPTLLVFRDGILLHRQAGMLPTAALDQLVRSVQAVDMDAVRAQSRESA
jgi:thioredoxin 1